MWFVFILLAALVASAALLKADELPRGSFEGTGRACSGKLTIASSTLSWRTPFSRCENLAYAVIERTVGEKESRTVYRLNKPNRQCRYSVLLLTHARTLGAGIGWNVIGYRSEKEFLADDRVDALSCYLVH